MISARSVRLSTACLLLLAVAACGRDATEPGGQGSTRKKLYWVQGLKGHPVHQLTQIAFLEGCRKWGYDGEIIGADSDDLSSTIALAEQVLAKGDAAGMAVWTGNPGWNPFIEKAARAGVPIVLPHFPSPEGSVPGARGIISCDPAEYAAEAAREIGKAIGGKGAVAVTQGSFNSTENLVAATFARTMGELYPEVNVLEPQEESFDAPKAIARAVSILQANPDVVAALSTTGNGATTWSGAQRETGRTLVVVAMDYTRINLDLVNDGSIHAVIGQPLWEESFGAAELLDRIVRGESIPWWTKLAAPFLTRDETGPYYALIDKVEASIER